MPFTPAAKVVGAVFVIPRMTLGVIVTLDWSFSAATLLFGAEFGSALSAANTCAVLVIGETRPVTVALIVRVGEAPLLTMPRFQIPEPAVYVPWVGVADTKVRPAGNWSITFTPVSVAGPLLVSVSVKVTLLPGVVLLVVLVRLRSDIRPGAVARSPQAGAPVAFGNAVATRVVVFT